MFWEKCNIGYVKQGLDELVKISRPEALDEQPYCVYISKEAFAMLQREVPLSNALEGYSLDIKEFLISGFEPIRLPTYIGLEGNINTAYVTNAVANSVVFYAMAYLNNKGLSSIEIKKLRIKYSLGNLESRHFSADELKQSFVNQSIFFLNLYKDMNEHDRFEYFAENLELQNRFNEVFRNYNNFLSLKRQYNRRVFHDNIECAYMRSDYNEKTFHRNTGVFKEKDIIKNKDYYMVDGGYLTELNMRLCIICQKGK
jgi:hypothetical protein